MIDYHSLGRKRQLNQIAIGGEFGLELTGMLQQARNFAHSSVGNSEFPILKFDKCTNWQHIVDACDHTLGLAMFKTHGNLNTRTLEELRGKKMWDAPNIVMIDFADANRCRVIRGLNDLSAAQPADLA
jgi:hypothetical protein